MIGSRAALLRADVVGVFDPERFATARLPAHVGQVTATASPLPSCLDMLVMLPGGSITVPEPYRSDPLVGAFLDAATAYEDDLLPSWRATRHLYLTVDHRWVVAGATHRNAGWHFDGMQGTRYPKRLPACHQYVCADALTTEFASAPTDAAGLDINRHNWFEALGDQIPAGHVSWTPRPLEIICMSAYQLHRSPVAATDTWRTFLRLDVSCKEQDRLGNTLNPDLPAPFAYVPRALPEGLERPVSDSSWAGAVRYV